MVKRYAAGRRAAWIVPLALAAIVAAMIAVALAADDGACPTLEFRERLYDVTFVGDNEAWVVGYPGLVMHTTDGAQTWNRECELGDYALFAVDFVGKDLGWAVGREGQIIHTVDGGKTWLPDKPVTEEALFDVDFADEKHGIAVGNFGVLLRTEDGGQTWIDQVLEPMANAQINAVSFVNAHLAFIAGEYPLWEAQLDENVQMVTLSNIFRSTDGGATWHTVHTGHQVVLNDVFFKDEREGWVVGVNGLLLHTTDGGETWEAIDTGVKAHLNKIALGPDAVWVAGLEGTLLKVVGAQANLIGLKAYTWLSAVGFSAAGNGVVIGGRGTLFATQDNGGQWTDFPIKR